jgi:hypothetical protein
LGQLRRRLVVLLAAASAAFGVAALAPAVEPVSVTETAAAHSCRSGYVHAHVPWGQKCLRAGQFCKIDQDRVYHRFGFHCHRSSRDSRGNYHLTR